MEGTTMKVLFILVGENQRHRNAPNQPGYAGIINSTDCVDNWNATLFEDLKSNGIEYDVIFKTYQSPILEELTRRVSPVRVITDGPPRQIGHLKTAASLLLQEKNNYDRFIITRFDFQYRIKITKWPKWDHTGIILASRDVGWDANKCYHDILFVVDSCCVEKLNDAIEDATAGGEYNNRVGSYLYHNKIPFELMYEHGYHILNHPLYALKHFDAEPDIENPAPGIIITAFKEA
jgi:hypothetical protein